MRKQKDGFKGERIVVLPPMIVDAERKDALASSLYITDIGYYPAAANHYRQREEPIGEHVLIYCVKGSGWYELRGERYDVKAGEFFILPAGDPHTYGTGEDPWTIYWIHFSGLHAEHYSLGLQTPHAIRSSIDSRIGDRNNLFEEMLNTLLEGYDMEHLRYVSSLLHYYLASMCFLHLYRHAPKGDAQMDPVHAAIHYMKENMERHLTLEEITHYVGYGVSQFSRLFKQQTGHSPVNYYNMLKVQRACVMLTETDMKINQISFKLGIEDPYYFSRLFVKVMQMSPSDYRKMGKNG